MDPRSIRPRRDWCSVLMEERREKLGSGLLFAPIKETGVEKVTEGAATIIAVGPGEMNAALELKAGDRVILRNYLQYANPLDSEERWPSGAHKQYFLVSSKDIMAVVPEGVDVGVFSGRPQNAEKK